MYSIMQLELVYRRKDSKKYIANNSETSNEPFSNVYKKPKSTLQRCEINVIGVFRSYFILE